MITNISSGKYSILESNVVYLVDDESDLTLHFAFKDDFQFDLHITFIVDEDVAGARLERKTNGNVLEAMCYNFNNSLGTGTSIPINVATIDDKKMYIHFWSFLLGDANKKQARKIEYTVFMEKVGAING